jgi:hypothetical protein
MGSPPSRLSKHVRAVLDRLPGWTPTGTTGGGHVVLQHPSGARTIVSGGKVTSRRLLLNDVRSARQALAQVEARA